MNHTPGPWKQVSVRGGWDGVQVANGGTTICTLALNVPDNARLIAAAPDLLEACQFLLETAEKAPWSQMAMSRALDHIRAAVAKAIGR
jgi:hypothetical protein